jgi:hypothetical protein
LLGCELDVAIGLERAKLTESPLDAGWDNLITGIDE